MCRLALDFVLEEKRVCIFAESVKWGTVSKGEGSFAAKCTFTRVDKNTCTGPAERGSACRSFFLHYCI